MIEFYETRGDGRCGRYRGVAGSVGFSGDRDVAAKRLCSMGFELQFVERAKFAFEFFTSTWVLISNEGMNWDLLAIAMVIGGAPR